jgi:hypothetical protein
MRSANDEGSRRRAPSKHALLDLDDDTSRRRQDSEGRSRDARERDTDHIRHHDTHAAAPARDPRRRHLDDPAASSAQIAPKIMPRSAPIASNQPSTSYGQPRPLARLLDADLELCPDELTELLSEQHDFSVVGVLGMQGVGKSRVLSEICGYRRASPADTGPGGLLGRFAEQSSSQVLEGLHCTAGVEVCVCAAEQLILIDIQPLMSASILIERGRSLSGGPPFTIR